VVCFACLVDWVGGGIGGVVWVLMVVVVVWVLVLVVVFV
jgi:hypothetical protein